MNKKQMDALTQHFEDLHNNPPAPLNPNYFPRWKECREYAKKEGWKLVNDSMTSKERGDLYNRLFHEKKQQIIDEENNLKKDLTIES